MQEIKYEDGTETKELFNSFEDALEDAKQKNKKNPIKKLEINLTIPSKRKSKG